MNASRSRLRGGSSAPPCRAGRPRRCAVTRPGRRRRRRRPAPPRRGRGPADGVPAPPSKRRRPWWHRAGRPGPTVSRPRRRGPRPPPGPGGSADAGVTDQQHAAELPVRRGGELPLQHGQLAFRPTRRGRAWSRRRGRSGRHRRRAARSCACRSCAARWRACRRPCGRSPVDGHRRHRLGQAFEGEPAGVPEAEPAPGADESATSSLARIWAPWASLHSRLAVTTASPWKSPPSRSGSPA